jgi:hypothetical protein
MSCARVSCSFRRHLSMSANGAARSAIARQNPSTVRLGTLSATDHMVMASAATFTGTNMPLVPWPPGLQFHQRVEQSTQVGGGPLDVGIFVLVGTRLCGKYCTAVDPLEVAVRKLVAVLGIWRLFVVLAQVPPGKLDKPVLLDEALLRRPRRLVIGPSIALVEYAAPVADELLRVHIRESVQRDRHGMDLGAAAAATASSAAASVTASPTSHFRSCRLRQPRSPPPAWCRDQSGESGPAT